MYTYKPGQSHIHYYERTAGRYRLYCVREPFFFPIAVISANAIEHENVLICYIHDCRVSRAPLVRTFSYVVVVVAGRAHVPATHRLRGSHLAYIL